MDVKTTFRNLVRDQSVSICMLQRLRRSGIDSKESIPQAYLAWRADMITLFAVTARQAT